MVAMARTLAVALCVALLAYAAVADSSERGTRRCVGLA
jgi:hypothetical protein